MNDQGILVTQSNQYVIELGRAKLARSRKGTEWRERGEGGVEQGGIGAGKCKVH